MCLKEEGMDIYLVQTAREMVNRSSGSEQNKIHCKLRISTTPKSLQNEMVNKISNELLFINFHFFIRYGYLWVSLTI